MELFLNNILWMSWNAFLALIPFLLASLLFTPRKHRNLLWTIGFILFVLFLPNAPYVFTDIIHLPTDWAKLGSNSALFAFTWQYFLLIAVGYWLFCKSYYKFENFVFKHFTSHQKVWARVVSFTIISVGVYLGRFPRFNSWDVFFKPQELVPELLSIFERQSLLFVALFTLLLYFSYISYGLFHQIKEDVLLGKK